MLYERTQRLAGGTQDLNTLLQVLDPILHGGPPPIIPPGSEASKTVRKQILKHPTWFREDAVNQERTKESQHPLTVSCVRRVALDQEHADGDSDNPRRIMRRRRPRKTQLTDTNKQLRLKFCDNLEDLCGLPLADAAQLDDTEVNELTKVILIGVDEYCVAFGGSGNQLISLLEGEDAYPHAQPCKGANFKLMQWAAGCSHPTKALRPQVIWEPETSESIEHLAQRLRDKKTTII
ncbi:hypothetical protein PMIN04_011860 [Paraphaeosphaeria minitans]